MIIFDWVVFHPFFTYVILIPFFMIVFYMMDLYDEQKKSDEDVDTDKCVDLASNNFWPAVFWLPMVVMLLLVYIVFRPLTRLTIYLARRK